LKGWSPIQIEFLELELYVVVPSLIGAWGSMVEYCKSWCCEAICGDKRRWRHLRFVKEFHVAYIHV